MGETFIKLSNLQLRSPNEMFGNALSGEKIIIICIDAYNVNNLITRHGVTTWAVTTKSNVQVFFDWISLSKFLDLIVKFNNFCRQSIFGHSASNDECIELQTSDIIRLPSGELGLYIIKQFRSSCMTKNLFAYTALRFRNVHLVKMESSETC